MHLGDFRSTTIVGNLEKSKHGSPTGQGSGTRAEGHVSEPLKCKMFDFICVCPSLSVIIFIVSTK